jgi:hypothetical protein
VAFLWVIRFDDGTVATSLYDDDLLSPSALVRMDTFPWHIDGHSQEAVARVNEVVAYEW